MGLDAPWQVDQGSNLCLLHWQAESLPLDYHGSSLFFFFLLPGSLVVNNKMVSGIVWAIALLCAEDLAVLKTNTAFAPSIHVST